MVLGSKADLGVVAEVIRSAFESSLVGRACPPVDPVMP